MRIVFLNRFAFCLWLVCLCVYVLSFVIYINFQFFLLLPVVLITFAAMIWMCRKELKFDDIFAKGNGWANTIAVLCFLFACGNAFFCFLQLHEGGPDIYNGVYCLWNHGFVREITREEYIKLNLAEGRLFSGHIMAFAAIANAGIHALYNTRKNKKFLNRAQYSAQDRM